MAIQHTYLQEEELVRRAIMALLRSLGPVEATRFLSMPRTRPLNSVGTCQVRITRVSVPPPVLPASPGKEKRQSAPGYAGTPGG